MTNLAAQPHFIVRVQSQTRPTIYPFRAENHLSHPSLIQETQQTPLKLQSLFNYTWTALISGPIFAKLNAPTSPLSCPLHCVKFNRTRCRRLLCPLMQLLHPATLRQVQVTRAITRTFQFPTRSQTPQDGHDTSGRLNVEHSSSRTRSSLKFHRKQLVRSNLRHFSVTLHSTLHHRQSLFTSFGRIICEIHAVLFHWILGHTRAVFNSLYGADCSVTVLVVHLISRCIRAI